MKNLFQSMAYCFYLGWREAWAEKMSLITVFVSYAILISVWASVWLMVPQTAMDKMGLTYNQIIWYFTTTELIIFTLTHMYKDVQEDIRGGMMTMFLLRPVGYVALKVSEWMGYACLKLAVLGTLISVYVFALTGYFPFSVKVLPVLAVMLCFGLFIWLLLQTIIGLTAAWFQSARPIFMIVQKGLFVLGGMIVPVTLFPKTLLLLVWALPFPAILYAPASLILDNSVGHILGVLGLQILWIVICLIGMSFMQTAFERRLLMKGEV